MEWESRFTINTKDGTDGSYSVAYDDEAKWTMSGQDRCAFSVDVIPESVKACRLDFTDVDQRNDLSA